MKSRRRIPDNVGFRTPLPWPAWEQRDIRGRARRWRIFLLLGVVVAALAVVAAILLTGGEEPEPTPPVIEALATCSAPPAMSIAYSRFQDQTLYRLGGDAQEPLTLMQDAQGPRYPIWSPEGTRISFRTGDKLAVVGADGGPVRELMDFPPGAGWWQWSPDGRYIAIQGHDAGEMSQWRLYAVEAETGSVTTVGAHSVASPIWWNWAPGGHRLTFAVIVSGRTRVETVQADGSQRITLSEDAGADPQPEWIPDGQAVIFQNSLSGTLDVVGADTGALLEQIPGQWAGFGRDDRQTPWSPDGRHLAYRAEDSIVVVTWQGGAVMSVTDRPGPDTYLAWSPDGTRVLFSSPVDGQGGLFSKNIRVGDTLQLFDAPAQEATWSPDSTWIAFAAGTSVYVVRADGTDLKQLAESPGAFQVAWSPDSRYLAFRGEPGAVDMLDVTTQEACQLGDQITDFAWRPAAQPG